MSKLFKINFSDVSKAFIVFFIASILQGVVQIMNAGNVPTQEELVSILGVSFKASIAYLFKNVLTNSKGKFMKKEI